MNIYECGIMDKLVYSNTTKEKAYTFLACGSWALRGRIRAENSQGGHIVKGETERSDKLN